MDDNNDSLRANVLSSSKIRVEEFVSRVEETKMEGNLPKLAGRCVLKSRKGLGGG